MTLFQKDPKFREAAWEGQHGEVQGLSHGTALDLSPNFCVWQSFFIIAHRLPHLVVYMLCPVPLDTESLGGQ